MNAYTSVEAAEKVPPCVNVKVAADQRQEESDSPEDERLEALTNDEQRDGEDRGAARLSDGWSGTRSVGRHLGILPAGAFACGLT
jgi:hypothetical protein